MSCREAAYFDSDGAGVKGKALPLAELRGGSLLSECRGEASCAGRGEGPRPVK